MSPPKSHFADINLLGADFCDTFKFLLLFLGNGKVSLRPMFQTASRSHSKLQLKPLFGSIPAVVEEIFHAEPEEILQPPS